MQHLPKSTTGIQGLDELTGGGFPLNRCTLVCGGAGCGKTLLGMSFLVHGAMRQSDPGVFMAFEESCADLALNVASLGFDLDGLTAQSLLLLDSVRVERSEFEESGEYNLEGLFIRLGHAIDSIGAKRVVLDTLESLFTGVPNQAILRAELRRLFRWLKDKGVTTVITAERGTEANSLTRQGLEEYVSDCVIVLDHRVAESVSSRRLRVVKYRGSTHGTNEYPFLIDERGFSLLPVTSLGLQHASTQDRISSGVPELDEMLGGSGFYQGSSILVSGTAGTGKSSLAAHFASAACARNERVMYFAFEESSQQIIRNMGSIGINMRPWVDHGLLKIQSSRPTLTGLEMHLATMLKEIMAFQPAVVVVDPLNSFVAVGNENDVKLMLLRLVDYLKSNQITAFFTSLTAGGDTLEQTDVAISSLIDSWLLVRDMECAGERNRGLYILKSRGMQHSNQIREFTLTDHGIELRLAYMGAGGVLTGSARVAQEAVEQAALVKREQDIVRLRNEMSARRAAMEARVVSIRAEFTAEEAALQTAIDNSIMGEMQLNLDRQKMAASRMATKSSRFRHTP